MQIYKTTNIINNKIYIGKDENNRNNYLGSGLILKQAIKKYGKENFRKAILEECESRSDLIEKEIYWIKKLNSITPNGYNIAKGGNGGDTWTNHPDREKIIEKVRIKNKNKKRSKEFCENSRKIALAVDPKIRKRAGIKAAKTKKARIKKYGFTEAELNAHKKNSEFLKEFNQSEEGRAKISIALKGKKKPPFTKEHIKNISKSSKGRKIPGRKIEIEGEKYESLHEASRKLIIPLMTIRNRLINKNFPNYKYL